MKPPFWSSPPNHIPSSLARRLIPVLDPLGPPGLPEASAPTFEPLELGLPDALCLPRAWREQGVTQTGSQEFSTAARLATGPLMPEAPPPPPPPLLPPPPDSEAPSRAAAPRPESLLPPELELELEGLRLSSELENFHWGILGMSMQKVVTPSCSPSRQGESASAGAGEEEEDEEAAAASRARSRGGSGRPAGPGDGTTGVATTLPLMAMLCMRSSEEVTESLRKRPYFGLCSMPRGAERCGETDGGDRSQREIIKKKTEEGGEEGREEKGREKGEGGEER